MAVEQSYLCKCCVLFVQEDARLIDVVKQFDEAEIDLMEHL